MRPHRYDDPRLLVVQGKELPLTGRALLELMRAVLGRGLPFRFCARGWSMAPFIRDGDVITVAPLLGTRPGIGEVVAFIRPDTGNLVVHRIVARRGPSSLVRGDGVAACDELVPPENLLGRVTRVERHGHNVCLGLGVERYLIAWLSRQRLLSPLRLWMTAPLRLLLRR